MSKQIDALKMALEALELTANKFQKQREAITAIKEALAQQSNEQVEPVADVLIDHEDEDGHAVMWLRDYALENGRHLLYTNPPQRTWERPWVSLTDEEIRKLCVTTYGGYEFCRLVEAKLKEKNT